MTKTTTALAFILALAACGRGPVRTPEPLPVREHTLIPLPATLDPLDADSFVLATSSIIVAQHPEAQRIGRYLAALIGNTVESTPRIVEVADTTRSVIELAIDPGAPAGEESYELNVTREKVRVAARTPAGLFYGVQTLRQLLPYYVEYTGALARPMAIPTTRIVDAPRFEWRGVMLDVSRHFLPPADVKEFMDLMVLYKLNRLHLHLSDDQGWRIEIPSWPNLTAHGGSSQVGGLGGGFYTLDEFRDLVQYAADRFITIVPEIDMPGHTNAALSSYPELNCDSIAPPIYTGTRVGFSSLCVEKEITYEFVDDVVRTISEVSPGPYFHAGGAEEKKLSREAYDAFLERVEQIVESHGKRMIGWSEIDLANLSGRAIVQSWIPDSSHVAAARGSKIILSPSNRMYYDMQYDTETPIGLHWAAYIDLETAYDWEPAEYNPLLPPESILGLEAPFWSETFGKLADVQYMALPRVPALSELAWSPPGVRNWPDFRARVRAHEARWTALGWNFRRE